MDDYDYLFSGIFRGKSRGIVNDSGSFRFLLVMVMAMVWLDYDPLSRWWILFFICEWWLAMNSCYQLARF